MLNLDDIAEGRALLARAKSGEAGAREALGAWFEAWGGLVLDMFERIHAPLLRCLSRGPGETANQGVMLTPIRSPRFSSTWRTQQ
jgi:hypothetical protein